MAWHDPVTDLAPNALWGVGLVIAAPIVFPVVRNALRPVAKSMIKGYLTVQDTVTEWTAETGEHMSDLVAEAKAEHQAPADQATSTKIQSSSSTSSARKKSTSSATKSGG
jgi:hypothetical protein